MILRNIRIYLLLLAIIGFGSFLHSKHIIKELNVIKEFPNEKQMDEGDFVLGKLARSFIIYDNSIYYCSVMQGTIFRLDLEGNLIKRYGRHGKGPGDLGRPQYIREYNNEIYVTDYLNGRIEVLTPGLKHVKYIRTTRPLSGFLVADNKFFINIGWIDNDNDNEKLFTAYDLEGRKLFRFGNPKGLKSRYTVVRSGNLHIDNSRMFTLKLYNNKLHTLQIYDTKFRIYTLDGNLEREFMLNRNPRSDDKEYKKIKYLWAYHKFLIDNSLIFAPYAAKGKINIDVFNMNGEFQYTYCVKMKEKNELYSARGFALTTIKGKKYIFLLLALPEISILKIQL